MEKVRTKHDRITKWNNTFFVIEAKLGEESDKSDAPTEKGKGGGGGKE